MTPEEMERLAGRLLVDAFKARRDRGGPEDLHEMRHIVACLEVGNSEHGDTCPLDGTPITIKLPTSTLSVEKVS